MNEPFTYSKDLKVYVVELNAFPGFPEAGRFNLSKRIIQQVEDKKMKDFDNGTI